MSLQTVLRIWDCLFNEGSKIIFRVALTLIKQHQEFILEAASIPDICDKFKQITKGSFVMECHTFMQVSVCRAARGSVPSPRGPHLTCSPGAPLTTWRVHRTGTSEHRAQDEPPALSCVCPLCLASEGFPVYGSPVFSALALWVLVLVLMAVLICCVWC